MGDHARSYLRHGEREEERKCRPSRILQVRCCMKTEIAQGQEESLAQLSAVRMSS